MYKSASKKNISIQLLIVTGLLIVASMFYKYASAVYKDYQVETEIKNLETEISDLKEKNRKMERLMEYLDTNAYKEIIAKSELNMRRRGEIVIALKEDIIETKENKEAFTPDSVYQSIPIYRKWLLLFWDANME